MTDKREGAAHHAVAAEQTRRLRVLAAILIAALSTTVILLREGQRAPLWLQRALPSNPESSGPGWGPWGIPRLGASPERDASGVAAAGAAAAATDATGAPGDAADGGGVRLRLGVQHIEQPAVAMWEEGEPFTAPHSGCTVHADGGVSYDPSPMPASGLPFLFDTSQFKDQEFRVRMCGEAAAGSSRYRGKGTCFGPCIFQTRLCDQVYRRSNRSAVVAQQYQAAGWRFGRLSPCELFQRIRGRTLWFMGDSQTCHFYYAAECFLREFAPTLRRHPPFPREVNMALNSHDPPIYPTCLRLAHGTRVCQLRVDEGETLVRHVLPLLVRSHPQFANDVVLFNFGLHYGQRGREGFLTDIQLVKQWRQARGPRGRPDMVWMDVPMQHFDSYDGRFNASMGKRKRELECRNLTAWYEGVPEVVQGGVRNRDAAPHVAAMADAHLRTWNASAPLWDVHMTKGDCTHYCSPTAYHIWLFLLNQELARSGVGNAPVRTREVGGGGSGGGSGGGVEGADEGGTEDGSSSAGDAAGWRGSSSDAAAAAAAAAGSGAEDWGEEADDDK